MYDWRWVAKLGSGLPHLPRMEGPCPTHFLDSHFVHRSETK